MKFSRRKLPSDAIASLRKVQVTDCEPSAILLTPVYVYLLQNQKFVAIKGPLTFFEQAELDKFKSFENLYLPEFIDQVAPFQKAGRTVRDLLQTRQTFSMKTHEGRISIVMPAPQYELDDAVLREIGPLWSEMVSLEPFFLCIFMEEVCQPLAADVLAAAVEKNTELFELALLRSSAAVFLALHVGYCDLSVLRHIRDAAFASTMNEASGARVDGGVGDLLSLVRAALPDAETRTLSISRFIELLKAPGMQSRNTRKLIARLTRVGTVLVRAGAPTASIYGVKGLLDE